MICRHCGLDSTTPNVCSNCGQPLKAEEARASDGLVNPVTGTVTQTGKRRPPAPGISMPGKSASKSAGARKLPPLPPPSRIPDFKTEPSRRPAEPEIQLPHIEFEEVADTHTDVQNAAPALSPAPAAAAKPADVTVQTAAVNLYPAAPEAAPAASSRPARPSPSSPVDEVILLEPQKGIAFYLGRYAALLVPMLLLQGILTYFAPSISVIPYLIVLMVGALLLPVMRVTPFLEDDPDDIALAVVLGLLFGPGAGLIIYGVLALIRQTLNSSLAGCMIIGLAARLVMDVAHPGMHLTLQQILLNTMPFTSFTAAHFKLGWNIVRPAVLDWLSLAAIIGWVSASTLRRSHEG